ncbi:pyridoxamine 5'-phosphate oxidase family protein [Propionispora hippei]|uniref:Nitroimidazol reductase NimA, pyridoxamine 5'-phosphate oxidase superfamily n=1 Tax=Propionispora hippei DSM 15287 TaxID=1123003 RepID=A0A1M6MXR3_9FIRM|nr:pyridoxamine 5'-phosphate oxidase family protein [Propionispora hippei]SHJ88267.1 hypothetical protein SAMN02745170_03578 [Propionispora hippei DSM 15287]
MFKPMRRKEKQLSEPETNKIMAHGEYGTLATLGDNGYPYTTPLNYAYDEAGQAIYFHSALAGNKVDNMNYESKVCFSVVGYTRLLPEKFDTEYDSAIAFGKVLPVNEGAEKEKALELLIKKYSAEFWQEGREYIARSQRHTTVYKIQVEHLTGKRGR